MDNTTTLTVTENQRIENVTAHLDDTIANAMRKLYEITKAPNPAADELIAAAHIPNAKCSPSTTAALEEFGLIHFDGRIPKAIRAAIIEAVENHYLEIKNLEELKLKYAPNALTLH